MDPRLLQLHSTDNVAVAIRAIEAGDTLPIDGQQVVCRERVPSGHKIALTAIAAGQHVVKYGCPIGSATRDIQIGQHVHTQNLKSDYLPADTLAE